MILSCLRCWCCAVRHGYYTYGIITLLALYEYDLDGKYHKLSMVVGGLLGSQRQGNHVAGQASKPQDPVSLQIF